MRTLLFNPPKITPEKNNLEDTLPASGPLEYRYGRLAPFYFTSLYDAGPRFPIPIPRRIHLKVKLYTLFGRLSIFRNPPHIGLPEVAYRLIEIMISIDCLNQA